MTDINKLIEEEARICVKNTPNTCSNFVEYGFTKGAQFGYNLCLYECKEAERWRKVEEELPELKDDPYTINIRTIGKPISVSTWYIRDKYDIQILEKMKGCEWKPIS